MKKLSIVCCLCVCVLSFSCKRDFLEVPDKTVLLKQAYVTDLSTTGNYLNGIYVKLASKYFSGTELPYAEIIADNMKPVVGGSLFIAQYNWQQQANTTGEFNLNRLWNVGYGIIRDCSFVIAAADRYRKENEAKAADLKGQALVIRALAHFVLVNTFAQSFNFKADASHPGIPYITTDDIEVAITRQTVAEVYDGMITDLNAAMQLLPPDITRREIVNYQAAKALLARVHLFKEEYGKAKDVAVQVLNAVPLMFDNYPQALYTAGETEALFRLPPGAYADGYEVLFTGYFLNPNALAYLATNDIAQLLREDENDKRSAWVVPFEAEWLVAKFPEGAAGTFPVPNGDYYQTLLRSSEMCLIAAEAYAHLNNEDSARHYLDMIRKRANPGLGSTTASGRELLEAIYKERRKELAFDGFRMFDLQRWKMGVDRMDALSSDIKHLPYPSNKSISPIPQQDVDLAGLSQNPAY